MLGALVDKSLVQFGDAGTGQGRYRLLETVRQYAAGQLDALGQARTDRPGSRTAITTWRWPRRPLRSS